MISKRIGVVVGNYIFKEENPNPANIAAIASNKRDIKNCIDDYLR